MESAGDVLQKMRIARQLTLPEDASVPPPGALTRHQQEIIDAATLIKECWPDASDLAFMAKHLVQVTLPHRDPGDVPFWSRTNGDLTLVIARTQVNEEANQLIGYPYGTIPRLLLYWITREAVRSKSRRLELGVTDHLKT